MPDELSKIIDLLSKMSRARETVDPAVISALINKAVKEVNSKIAKDSAERSRATLAGGTPALNTPRSFGSPVPFNPTYADILNKVDIPKGLSLDDTEDFIKTRVLRPTDKFSVEALKKELEKLTKELRDYATQTDYADEINLSLEAPQRLIDPLIELNKLYEAFSTSQTAPSNDQIKKFRQAAHKITALANDYSNITSYNTPLTQEWMPKFSEQISRDVQRILNDVTGAIHQAGEENLNRTGKYPFGDVTYLEQVIDDLRAYFRGNLQGIKLRMGLEADMDAVSMGGPKARLESLQSAAPQLVASAGGGSWATAEVNRIEDLLQDLDQIWREYSPLAAGERLQSIAEHGHLTSGTAGYFNTNIMNKMVEIRKAIDLLNSGKTNTRMSGVLYKDLVYEKQSPGYLVSLSDRLERAADQILRIAGFDYSSGPDVTNAQALNYQDIVLLNNLKTILNTLSRRGVRHDNLKNYSVKDDRVIFDKIFKLTERLDADANTSMEFWPASELEKTQMSWDLGQVSDNITKAKTEWKRESESNSYLPQQIDYVDNTLDFIRERFTEINAYYTGDLINGPGDPNTLWGNLSNLIDSAKELERYFNGNDITLSESAMEDVIQSADRLQEVMIRLSPAAATGFVSRSLNRVNNYGLLRKLNELYKSLTVAKRMETWKVPSFDVIKNLKTQQLLPESMDNQRLDYPDKYGGRFGLSQDRLAVWQRSNDVRYDPSEIVGNLYHVFGAYSGDPDDNEIRDYIDKIVDHFKKGRPYGVSTVSDEGGAVTELLDRGPRIVIDPLAEDVMWQGYGDVYSMTNSERRHMRADELYKYPEEHRLNEIVASFKEAWARRAQAGYGYAEGGVNLTPFNMKRIEVDPSRVSKEIVERVKEINAWVSEQRQHAAKLREQFDAIQRGLATVGINLKPEITGGAVGVDDPSQILARMGGNDLELNMRALMIGDREPIESVIAHELGHPIAQDINLDEVISQQDLLDAKQPFREALQNMGVTEQKALDRLVDHFTSSAEELFVEELKNFTMYDRVATKNPKLVELFKKMQKIPKFIENYFGLIDSIVYDVDTILPGGAKRMGLASALPQLPPSYDEFPREYDDAEAYNRLLAGDDPVQGWFENRDVDVIQDVWKKLDALPQLHGNTSVDIAEFMKEIGKEQYGPDVLLNNAQKILDEIDDKAWAANKHAQPELEAALAKATKFINGFINTFPDQELPKPLQGLQDIVAQWDKLLNPPGSKEIKTFMDEFKIWAGLPFGGGGSYKDLEPIFTKLNDSLSKIDLTKIPDELANQVKGEISFWSNGHEEFFSKNKYPFIPGMFDVPAPPPSVPDPKEITQFFSEYSDWLQLPTDKGGSLNDLTTIFDKLNAFLATPVELSDETWNKIKEYSSWIANSPSMFPPGNYQFIPGVPKVGEPETPPEVSAELTQFFDDYDKWINTPLMEGGGIKDLEPLIDKLNTFLSTGVKIDKASLSTIESIAKNWLSDLPDLFNSTKFPFIPGIPQVASLEEPLDAVGQKFLDALKNWSLTTPAVPFDTLAPALKEFNNAVKGQLWSSFSSLLLDDIMGQTVKWKSLLPGKFDEYPFIPGTGDAWDFSDFPDHKPNIAEIDVASNSLAAEFVAKKLTGLEPEGKEIDAQIDKLATMYNELLATTPEPDDVGPLIAPEELAKITAPTTLELNQATAEFLKAIKDWQVITDSFEGLVPALEKFNGFMEGTSWAGFGPGVLDNLMKEMVKWNTLLDGKLSEYSSIPGSGSWYTDKTKYPELATKPSLEELGHAISVLVTESNKLGVTPEALPIDDQIQKLMGMYNATMAELTATGKATLVGGVPANFRGLRGVVPPISRLGNKRGLLSAGGYDNILSDNPDFERIIDPFGGGGVLSNKFQQILNIPRVFNDIDSALINFHSQVKDNLQGVLDAVNKEFASIKALVEQYPSGGPEAHKAVAAYWEDMKNRLGAGSPAERAVLTTITQSGGLGIMGKGDQKLISGPNAQKPYGWSFSNDAFTDIIHRLENHSRLLKDTEILNIDAREVLLQAGSKDLVLLDPPYVQRGSNDTRVEKYEYGKEFAELEEALRFISQDMLAANQRGVPMIYTNNAHPEIIKALQDAGFFTRLVDVTSQQGKRTEVVAYNEPATGDNLRNDPVFKASAFTSGRATGEWQATLTGGGATGGGGGDSGGKPPVDAGGELPWDSFWKKRLEEILRKQYSKLLKGVSQAEVDQIVDSIFKGATTIEVKGVKKAIENTVKKPFEDFRKGIVTDMDDAIRKYGAIGADDVEVPKVPQEDIVGEVSKLREDINTSKGKRDPLKPMGIDELTKQLQTRFKFTADQAQQIVRELEAAGVNIGEITRLADVTERIVNQAGVKRHNIAFDIGERKTARTVYESPTGTISGQRPERDFRELLDDILSSFYDQYAMQGLPDDEDIFNALQNELSSRAQGVMAAGGRPNTMDLNTEPLSDGFTRLTSRIQENGKTLNRYNVYLRQTAEGFKLLTQAEYDAFRMGKLTDMEKAQIATLNPEVFKFASRVGAKKVQTPGGGTEWQGGWTAASLKGVTREGSTGVTSYQFERWDENAKVLERLNLSTDKYGKVLFDTSKRFQTFTGAIMRNTMEVLKWGIAVSLIYGPMYKLQEIMANTIVYEAKLADVAIALGTSHRDAMAIFEDAASVAQNMGESITGVLDSYVLAYRAAGSINNEAERTAVANKLLADSLTLSKLAGIDQAKAMDLLSGALRQVYSNLGNVQSLQMGQELLDKWVATTKAANVDLATLATSFSIVSEQAENAGLSTEQLNAMVAVLSEKIGAMSPEETGNAIRGLIGGIYTDKAAKELSLYGIAVTDVEGRQRDFLDVMKQIYEMHKEGIIDDQQLNKIAQALGGGVRRGAQYLAFLSDIGRIEEIAAAQANAHGMAQDALGKKLDTVQTSMTRFGNTMGVIAQKMAMNGGVLNIIKLLTDALNLLGTTFGGVAGLAGNAGPLLFGALAARGYMRGGPGKEKINDIYSGTGELVGNVVYKVLSQFNRFNQPYMAKTSSGQPMMIDGYTGRPTTEAKDSITRAQFYQTEWQRLGAKYGVAAGMSFLAAISSASSGEGATGFAANLAGGFIGMLMSGGSPIGAMIGSAAADAIVDGVRKSTSFDWEPTQQRKAPAGSYVPPAGETREERIMREYNENAQKTMDELAFRVFSPNPTTRTNANPDEFAVSVSKLTLSMGTWFTNLIATIKGEAKSTPTQALREQLVRLYRGGGMGEAEFREWINKLDALEKPPAVTDQNQESRPSIQRQEGLVDELLGKFGVGTAIDALRKDLLTKLSSGDITRRGFQEATDILPTLPVIMGQFLDALTTQSTGDELIKATGAESLQAAVNDLVTLLAYMPSDERTTFSQLAQEIVDLRDKISEAEPGQEVEYRALFYSIEEAEKIAADRTIEFAAALNNATKEAEAFKIDPPDVNGMFDSFSPNFLPLFAQIASVLQSQAGAAVPEDQKEAWDKWVQDQSEGMSKDIFEFSNPESIFPLFMQFPQELQGIAPMFLEAAMMMLQAAGIDMQSAMAQGSGFMGLLMQFFQLMAQKDVPADFFKKFPWANFGKGMDNVGGKLDDTNNHLKDIKELEKKQLDGIYNLPTDASFYVPFSGYEMGYKNRDDEKGLGGGDTGSLGGGGGGGAGMTAEQLMEAIKLLMTYKDKPGTTTLQPWDSPTGIIPGQLPTTTPAQPTYPSTWEWPKPTSHLFPIFSQPSPEYQPPWSTTSPTSPLSQLPELPSLSGWMSTIWDTLKNLFNPSNITLPTSSELGAVSQSSILSGLPGLFESLLGAINQLSSNVSQFGNTPYIPDLPQYGPPDLSESPAPPMANTQMRGVTTAELKLSIRSDTRLFLDGKQIASSIKQYLLDEMMRLEGTSSSISRNVVI